MKPRAVIAIVPALMLLALPAHADNISKPCPSDQPQSGELCALPSSDTQASADGWLGTDPALCLGLLAGMLVAANQASRRKAKATVLS